MIRSSILAALPDIASINRRTGRATQDFAKSSVLGVFMFINPERIKGANDLSILYLSSNNLNIETNSEWADQDFWD